MTDNKNKTPVSTLQEFCVKHQEGPPFYELLEDVSDSTGEKQFVYNVSAFNVTSTGKGKNKKDAKHDAAQALLTKLQTIPKFQDDIQVVPDVPRGQIVEKDAVGALLDICVERNLPMAEFEIIQASGEAHALNFTCECRLSSIVRIGSYSTKKGAKQIAATEMLKVIQNMSKEPHNMQVAKIEVNVPEKIIKTYREYKKSDIKTDTGVKLCDRHYYFSKLPADKLQKAQEVLEMNDSAKVKAHLLCEVLNFKLEVKKIANHSNNSMVMLELFGDFDVALMDTEVEVYEKFIMYFTEMIKI